jgi:thiopeptide-type bacteriocin biosynthesis protein
VSSDAIFTHDTYAMARIPLAPTTPDGMAVAAPGLIAEGVFLASRSLDGADPDDHRVRASRTAYALRARTRTTPHGVWCAVAAASLDAEGTTLQLGDRHRCDTVPNPAWLLAVADRCLEAALGSLVLTVNDLAVRRGGRIECEHPGSAGTGQLSSVAATELSCWLLTRCSSPVPARSLIGEMRARWPGASDSDARTALGQMIRAAVLFTDLLPTDLRIDPLGHLRERLPAEHPWRASLGQLRGLLCQADTCPPGASRRLGLLRAAREIADRLHAVDRPFVVDTVADAVVCLPASAGEQAARTASVLWRIGHRTGPLGPWTARFTEMYGRHRLVPVLEAVDPALGLGPPGPDDALGAGSTLDDHRSRCLAGLITEALVRGRPDVELTPEHIRTLAHPAGGGVAPHTAEIHLRLWLSEDGRPLLAVGPHAAQDAGSAAARFTRLVPELARTDARQPAGEGAAVPAEIVCRPLTARAAALVPETGAYPHRIPIGLPMGKGDLPLSDLVIGFAEGHLVLRSQQLGREVRPVLNSRVSRHLLPPVAHLLHLLGHAGERPWHPFDHGLAAVFPWTPRVVHDGVVLAPQRWTLPSDLIKAATRRSTWAASLAPWMAGTLPVLPAHVVVEESDRVIPVDLGDREHQEIFRRSVAAGARSVAEPLGHAPGSFPMESMQGRHPLELVVPLRRRSAPGGTGTSSRRPDPRAAARSRADDVVNPGQGWLSTAIRVPPRLQDQALRSLPALSPRLAYWLRYRTPALGAHLRVRVRSMTTPGDVDRARATLAEWAAALAHDRLSDGLLHIEPYVRESLRYGGPAGIEAAETFFGAGSALAHSALSLPRDDRFILAAHHCADIAETIGKIASANLEGPSPTAIGGIRLTPPERRRRDELRIRARRHVPVEGGTVPDFRSALDTLASVLPPTTAHLTASDLIHLHCNRLLGTDPGAERLARSLASDLLHRRG